MNITNATDPADYTQVATADRANLTICVFNKCTSRLTMLAYPALPITVNASNKDYIPTGWH